MRFSCLSIVIFALAGIGCAARNARPPNVVIIFVDDMGYGDLTCYGSKGPPTPNIDRLAQQGIKFTDFYVAQAGCSAPRAARLSGWYNTPVGIQGALGP